MTIGIDDDADGKIDVEDEDCPVVEPTVVIESALDQAGNSLSPGDLIAPQKVTYYILCSGERNGTSP